MILDLELSSLLIFVLAFGLGGLLKGVASFGLPFIALPILAEGFPVPIAIALLTMPILLSNAYQIWRGKLLLKTIRRFWMLLASLLITISFSAQLLVTLNPQVLMMAIGISLVVFAPINLFKFQWKVSSRQEWWVSCLVGVISGIVGGPTSFYGSLTLIYFVSLNLPKEEFVAAASFILFSGGLFLTLMLAKFQVLTEREILLSALAVIPMFLGLLTGQSLRGKISQEVFQRAVIILLIVVGLSMILRNISVVF